MITASIAINGVVIAARSAVNTKRGRDGKAIYRVDDGGDLLHDPADGAVKLAVMLLERIEEAKGGPA